ncbi:iron-sulfur cluster carrier protein ApbC [Alcaligenaceae bacterium]|nr:iron-sulfur cluster carrier protein ApbC [Alcaligenaceae bacterium]
MTTTIDQLFSALSGVIDPNTKKKLSVTAKTGLITLDGVHADITVPLGYPSHNAQEELSSRIHAAIQPLGVQIRTLNFTTNIASHAVQKGLRTTPNIRNVIAVASGKGGVGKSTTSVNLALALRDLGARVGLLDADIYGPSVPIMLGLSGKPKSLDGKSMEPLIGYGLQTNSIGFLLEEDSPAIWRGPMVTQALQQLLTQTNWDDLDYLIVDMPPGTGDIALTMAQKVPLTGAVIVTTPQDMALADARRGLRMFQKVDVPVLGIIENMSMHICSNCGHAEATFGQDGGRNMASEFNLPWLGALPLQLSIRTQTDAGTPTVIAEPDGQVADIYRDIALQLAAHVATLPADMSAFTPKVVARKV